MKDGDVGTSEGAGRIQAEASSDLQEKAAMA